MRGAGFNVVINLGVIGGVIGGKLFDLFGVADGGSVVELTMAVVGAIVLLGLASVFRRS